MFSKHPAPTLSAKVAKPPGCDAGLEMHGAAFGGFPHAVQEPRMEFQPSEWVQIPHLGFFVGLTSAEVMAQRRLFYKHVCHYQQLIIPSMLGSRNRLRPFDVLTESNLPGLSCVFGRCTNSRGTRGTDLKQLSNIYIYRYLSHVYTICSIQV